MPSQQKPTGSASVYPSTHLGWMRQYQETSIKTGSLHALHEYYNNNKDLTAEHKVMLNCQTLEIYCTECKKEISDVSQYDCRMMQ